MRHLNDKRVSAALALVLVGQLAVSVEALAKTKSHNRKKSKKATRQVIKVHCASIRVRCQGTPGAQGPNGRNGTNGVNGANGYNGAQVITRARLVNTPLVTSASGDYYALTGNHWVQGPNEDDYLLGAVTFTTPSQCRRSGTGPGQVYVNIYVDGKRVGRLIGTGTPGQTETDGINFGAAGNPFADLPSSGTAQDHVLTTHVSDNCGSESSPSASDQPYVVKQVAVNVAAFS